jgi:ABC-type multidrug transport system fused ATPase/permease subunit
MRVLKRLLGFLKPYWKTLLLSALLILGDVGTGLAPPLLQGAIVDQVIEARDLSRLGTLVGLLVALYALQNLIGAGDMYIRHALGERFILDLRVRIYAYLQRLSLSFYERTSTGELMSRVTNDVNALEQFVTHGSAFLVVDTLRLAGAIAILLALDWRLALLALIPVPVLAASLRAFNVRVRPIYRRVRDRLGDINARLQDNLSGMRVIQAFGQEERELTRFAADSEGYYQERVRGIRSWATFFPAMHFVASLGMALVLGAGARMVVGEALSLGTLVVFISYLQSLYAPVNRLVEVDNVLQQAIAAGERIFELLDATSDVQDTPGAVGLPAMRGEVSFESVRFFYETGDVVLHEVTFRIAPGEVVALVGPSGAGKTSIANLLCRSPCPRCATRSPWSCKTPFSLTPPSARTCSMASRGPAQRSWLPRPGQPMRTTLSPPCPKAMTPRSASGVSA